MAPDTFQSLGYDKYAAKPHYSAFSLVRVSEGWTVLRVEMKGATAVSVTSVCNVTFKANALERLKIETARYIQNEAELKNSGKQA